MSRVITQWKISPASIGGGYLPLSYTLREDKGRPKAGEVAWAMYRDSDRNDVSKADPNLAPNLAGARFELFI